MFFSGSRHGARFPKTEMSCSGRDSLKLVAADATSSASVSANGGAEV